MALTFKMDTAQFVQAMQVEKEKLRAAARPAAQAGAQVIYDAARLNAGLLAPKKEHYFYGKRQRYGPFQPGNLMRSIYQVYSSSESLPDRPVYHVSWNYDKAPYAWMVEYGTSTSAAHSFLGKAITEKRREAMQVLKNRFVEELKK